ncbi:MAG: two-component system sensor histidine kinase QseC [Enterobacterales bacterium]
MKKTTLLITTLTLGLCWVIIGIILILILEHAWWQIDLFVTVIIALSVYKLWQNHLSIPIKKINNIEALAHTIKNREPNNVEPLPIHGQPDEIQPLLAALNHFYTLEKGRVSQEYTFSSEASHELRTPLTGIRLQTQIAQRTADPKQRDKALNNILKAVDKSTHLVEQLLTLSRLNLYYRQASLTSLNITELCQRWVDDYQTLAQSRMITLTRVFDETQALFILSNEEHIEIVLKNLLDNALRYTPSKGVVQISLQLIDNNTKLKLQVEDSGPGIPTGDYNRVQQPFQKSIDGQKRGAGLGLALVKRVAEVNNSQLLLAPSSLGGLSATILFTHNIETIPSSHK